jgi:hypothetical protein
MTQLDLPYNGTAGYVPMQASRERAHREVNDGTLGTRLQAVLNLLEQRGIIGATWQEVAQSLGLHHGQASGALSTLHRMGLVFSLRDKRNKCHPYVHGNLRHMFFREQRHDSPSVTRAGMRRALLDELHATCVIATEIGFTPNMQDAISMIVDRLAADERPKD